MALSKVNSDDLMTARFINGLIDELLSFRGRVTVLESSDTTTPGEIASLAGPLWVDEIVEAGLVLLSLADSLPFPPYPLGRHLNSRSPLSIGFFGCSSSGVA